MNKKKLNDFVKLAVLREVINLVDESKSLKFSTNEPQRYFDLTNLEGSFDESIYALINQVLFLNDLYLMILNKKGVDKVKNCWLKGFYLPSLDDEDFFNSDSSRIEEIENYVIAGLAIYIKKIGLNYSSYLSYFKTYGDDEMVKKLS